MASPSAANKPAKHIMLSYQWDSKAFVKTIFDDLKSRGYEVWMDVEGGMQREIYQSMAEGVENCAVFVPFLMSKYMESANCKIELQYATQHRKTVIPIMCEDFKATRWLEACITGLLWHPAFTHTMDASSLQSFHTAVNDAIPAGSPVRKAKPLLPHWETLMKKQPTELESAGFSALVESLIELNSVKACYSMDSIKQMHNKAIEEVENHFATLPASFSARKAQLLEQVETEFRLCYAKARAEVAKIDTYISQSADMLNQISFLGATVLLSEAVETLKDYRQSAGYKVQQLPTVVVEWPSSLMGSIATYGTVRTDCPPAQLQGITEVVLTPTCTNASGPLPVIMGAGSRPTSIPKAVTLTSRNVINGPYVARPTEVSTLAGDTEVGFVNGALKDASFNCPTGIAFSMRENAIYVFDQDNSAIRRIDLSSGTVGTLLAESNDAPVCAQHIVFYEKEACLFVADCLLNRILKISSAGAVTTFAGSGSASFKDGADSACFHYPTGIAIDQLNGTVYVADTRNRRICKVTQKGSVSSFTEGGLNEPWGLALSQNGDHLYVADWRNPAVRRVCCKTGAITTIAGNGQQGLVNGPGAAAQFQDPLAVALACDDTVLLVVDFRSHCIRKIVLTDRSYPVSTVAGQGSSGFADGEMATAKFNFPCAICVDPSSGVCYVADSNNNCIRSFPVN